MHKIIVSALVGEECNGPWEEQGGAQKTGRNSGAVDEVNS